MERVIRPIGDGLSEMICTCTSVTERDSVSTVVPARLPDTHEMEVRWLDPMSFRIAPRPKASAETATPAPEPAAEPPATPAVTTGADGNPQPSTVPPLTGLLAGTKEDLTKAKLADLETACAESGCPVVVEKNTPRATIVADILKWREERDKPAAQEA